MDDDSAASSGGEGKYTIHASFPSSPLEAVLSIVCVFFLLKIYEKELIKIKEISKYILYATVLLQRSWRL
jgi:hypothetical protein